MRQEQGHQLLHVRVAVCLARRKEWTFHTWPQHLNAPFDTFYALSQNQRLKWKKRPNLPGFGSHVRNLPPSLAKELGARGSGNTT